MSTPGTVTSMAVSSSRSSSPSASSTRQSHRHSYIHSNVHQPNHDQQYHIAMQLDGSLAFEPSSQKSHDLSPVQSQSHFAVGRAEVLGQHSCMWASCHAVFGSLQDLVAHVNVQHLQTVSTLLTANNQFDAPQDPPPTHHQPAPSPAGQVFPSCHWGDCHVYPTVENVPGSSDRPLDAALGVLAAHLWEYHLGLPTPPPQFNFPEVQTPTGEVEIVNAGPPPVPASLAAAEMSGVADILSSSQPPLDSVHNRIPTPTQDQDKAPDPSHDCTTTDHPCEWLDCQERFASCEALMTHVAVEHVGGGKNHYGCFWNGCGRNGENGFKSKQKICRHLQVRSSRLTRACVDLTTFYSPIPDTVPTSAKFVISVFQRSQRYSNTCGGIHKRVRTSHWVDNDLGIDWIPQSRTNVITRDAERGLLSWGLSRSIRGCTTAISHLSAPSVIKRSPSLRTSRNM